MTRRSHHLSTSCRNLASNRSVSSSQSMGQNVRRFQEGLQQYLAPNDQDLVTDILSLYHRNRNVAHLVASLTKVLKTSQTQNIFFLLREVLPRCDRPEYDHYVSMHLYNAHRDPGLAARGQTCDSGFGSTSVTTHSTGPRTAAFKQYSRKTNGHINDNSASSSGHSSTFGSAVRRKVIAALQRSSSKVKKVPVERTRRHSLPNHITHREESDRKSRPEVHPKLRIPSDAQVVLIDRLKSKGGDMGFSIRGGTNHNTGIFISQVDPNSIAEVSGLMVGDSVLRVNDHDMHNVTHEQAVKILTSYSRLYMTVVCNNDSASITTSQNFKWTDANGQTVSPPTNAKQPMKNKKSGMALLLTNERKVNISVRPGQSLGLSIRGGLEYELGVYITGVDEGSAADNAGLKPGDEILEVNGVDFRQITHTEAVNVIRSSAMLMMTLHHVGKIPQCDVSQAPFDDVTMPQHRSATLPRRPGGSLGVFDRAVTGSDQVTLRHAQSTSSLTMSTLDRALNNLIVESNDVELLTDAERKSLRYYVEEYSRGTVTVDDLVMSLSQLLNTHGKFSVMSAVRRCMLSRDLDRFDVLVLRRELESLKKSTLMQEKQHRKGTSFATADSIEIEEHVYATVDKTRKKSFVHSSRTNGNNTGQILSSISKNQSSGSSNQSGVQNQSSVYESPQINTSFGGQQHSMGTNTDIALENSSENNNCASQVSTSTPNSSCEIPPPPPIIISPPNKTFIHPKLKKTISPILPNPILGQKSKPPTKPKRTKSITDRNGSSVHVGGHSSKGIMVHRSPSPFSQAIEQRAKGSKTKPTKAPQLNHSSSDDSFIAPPREYISKPNTSNYGVIAQVHTNNEKPPYLDVNKNRTPLNDRRTAKLPSVPAIQVTADTEASSTDCVSFDYDSSGCESDPMERYRDVETQKIMLFKTMPALGLSIEGGANTRQPLPRVSKIQPGGCANLSGRLLPGHVIHKVNGKSLEGMQHTEVANIIASAFKSKDRDSIELVISGPHDTAI